ncbi:hypothetical protein FB639_006599, partial [Coemansia asiatica]
MTPANNISSTPKSARTQTSIFSFFNTPKKDKTKTAAAKLGSALKKDSQDELLAQADDLMDDVMLAEIETVEHKTAKNSARPTATPGGQKRKIKAAVHYKDDEDSDTGSDRENDDDNDDDYSPENGQPKNASATRRVRAVLDGSDDDDDDDMVDAAATSSESEAEAVSDMPSSSSSSPLVGRRAKPRTLRRGSRAERSPSTKTPDLKRMRLSNAGASASSDGPSLMSLLGGRQRPPVTPTVERTASSLSALSVATAEDNKRQRA